MEDGAAKAAPAKGLRRLPPNPCTRSSYCTNGFVFPLEVGWVVSKNISEALEPKWQQSRPEINKTPDEKSGIYASELKQYKCSIVYD